MGIKRNITEKKSNFSSTDIGYFFFFIFLSFLILILILPVNTHAEENEYSFIKENTMSGFRYVRDAFISNSLEDICILTYNSIFIINITSMKIVAQQQFDQIHFRGGCWINDTIVVTAFPNDPERYRTDNVLVFTSKNLTQIASISPISNPIEHIFASPNSKYIATYLDKKIIIFDSKTFSIEYQSENHAESVEAITWNSDSTSIASIGGDFWKHNILTNTQERLSSGYLHSRNLFWAPNGTYIYNIFSPGEETLECYNVATHEKIYSKELAYTINTGALNFDRNDICIAVETSMQIISLDKMIVVYTNADAAQKIRYIFWKWNGYRIVTLADDGVLRSFVDKNHKLFNEPPVITIECPLNGELYSSSIVALGTISDDSTTVIGFYQINSNPWVLFEKPSLWKILLDETNLEIGRNQFSVKATDGEKENFTQIYFYFHPNMVKPIIEISKPEENSRINRIFTIEGQAQDIYGNPLTILIRLNQGPWMVAIGAERWIYTTIVPSNYNQSITIEAKAFNGELESDIQTCTVFYYINSSILNKIPILRITKPIENENIVQNISYQFEVLDDNSTIYTFYSFNNISWTYISSQIQDHGELSTQGMSSGRIEIFFLSFDGEYLSNIVMINVTKVFYSPPVVTITQPSNNAYVQGTFHVRGYVENGYGDNFRIEIKVNSNEWRNTSIHRFWDVEIDENELINNQNFLYISAFDTYSRSDTITLIVYYLNLLIVSIDSPKTESHISDDIQIEGRVVGDEGYNFTVELRINNNEWTNVSNRTKWTYKLEVFNIPYGNISIEARVYDGTNYSRPTRIVLFYNPDITQDETNYYWFIIIIIILTLSIIISYILFKHMSLRRER